MIADHLSEADMLGPLLCWLRRSGRLRDGSAVATELPWCGRRVDLATVSKSGVATAYELKIRNNNESLTRHLSIAGHSSAVTS